MFVVFEGIDGSGKTTLTNEVSERLRLLEMNRFTTHEPTNSSVVDETLVHRRDPLSYLKLFFAFTEDRFTHQHIIKDHLERGEIVICDRYLLSSYAYQGSIIRTLFENLDETIKWMRHVSEIITVKPDITFLLDLEPAKAMGRLSGRKNFTSFESEDYLSLVHEIYRHLIDDDTIVLDATRSIATLTDEVVDIIVSRLRQ
jgi:dTMP kinase